MTIILVIAIAILWWNLNKQQEMLRILRRDVLHRNAEIKSLTKFILDSKCLMDDLKIFADSPFKPLQLKDFPKIEEELNLLAFYEQYSEELGLDKVNLYDEPPSPMPEMSEIIKTVTSTLTHLHEKYPKDIHECHIKWINYAEFKKTIHWHSDPDYDDREQWRHLVNYLGWLIAELDAYEKRHLIKISHDSDFMKLKDILKKLKDGIWD